DRVPWLRVQHDLHGAVGLVEKHVVAAWRVAEVHVMRDDEARIDGAGFDAREERLHVAMDMTLAGANRDAAVHQRAERELVDEAGIHAEDRDDAGVAAGEARLPPIEPTIPLDPRLSSTLSYPY